MSFKPGTKFGLNIKKKETKSGFSAFGSSSSSSSSSRGAPIAARTNAFGALKSACAEEEEDDYPANNALRPEDRVNRELAVAQSTISHQTRLELQKAINEDPNVFDYDGSYDERKKRELALKKSREGDIGADGRKKVSC